jgi:hypothetical protein
MRAGILYFYFAVARRRQLPAGTGRAARCKSNDRTYKPVLAEICLLRVIGNFGGADSDLQARRYPSELSGLVSACRNRKFREGD